MVKYVLNSFGFCYMPDNNTIELSRGHDDYNILTDNELISIISDSITHEFMHYLLHREFNLTVSKLFDTIGYLFYNNYKILNRLSNKPGSDITWKQYIKLHGIKKFYSNYDITKYDLILANNICKEV